MRSSPIIISETVPLPIKEEAVMRGMYEAGYTKENGVIGTRGTERVDLNDYLSD